MIAAGFGRIVNIADVAGLEPWPRFTAHSVAKAGVVMLTRSLAQTLAPGDHRQRDRARHGADARRARREGADATLRREDGAPAGRVTG